MVSMYRINGTGIIRACQLEGEGTDDTTTLKLLCDWKIYLDLAEVDSAPG